MLYECHCGRPSKTRVCRECQREPQPKPKGMPNVIGCLEDCYNEESDADSVCRDTVDVVRDFNSPDKYRYRNGKRVRMR